MFDGSLEQARKARDLWIMAQIGQITIAACGVSGVNGRPLSGGSALRLEASGHEPTPPRRQAAAPRNRLAHFRLIETPQAQAPRAPCSLSFAWAARDYGSREKPAFSSGW
jgi:hypothetical protein